MESLSPRDLRDLQDTQASFVVALERENFREALRLNTDLHFKVYTAANMPVRLKIVEGLWLRIGPTLHNMYPILGTHPRDDDNPHDKMLSAMAEHSPQKLREAVIADLDRSETALLEYVRRTREARSMTEPSSRSYR